MGLLIGIGSKLRGKRREPVIKIADYLLTANSNVICTATGNRIKLVTSE